MIGLISLVVATLAFVGGHFLLSHTFRLKLIGAVGELRFTLLYSIVAFATFGWMIIAYRAFEDEPLLWSAPPWWWTIASFIMLFALILLVGSFVRNPAFPHPGAAQKKRQATGVFAITRHPMNWAFALLASVHLTLEMSLPSIVLDSGILILAIVGSIAQDRKKRATMGQAWLQWEAKTSFVPFVALLAGRARWRDLTRIWIAALVGVIVWLALTTFYLPGASPLVWAWFAYH